MQQIMNEWRKYLLVEVSFEQAQKSLNSKKLLRSLAYQEKQHSPHKSPEEIEQGVRWSKHIIMDTVPRDITDNQKGASLLWIIRFAKKKNGMVLLSARGDWEISNNLEMFWTYQQFMEPRDINQITDADELSSVIGAARAKIETYQNKQKNLDVDEGTEVFLDNEYWSVAAIHNKGAACELGKGTDWCTAAPGLDYFKHYYKPDDPLFYFKNKKDTGKRFQFHYGSKQFMDEEDSQLHEEDAYVLHMVLMGTDAPKKYPIIEKNSKPIIASGTTDPSELDKLAFDVEKISSYEDIKVQRRVLRNPHTSPETISKMVSNALIILANTPTDHVLHNNARKTIAAIIVSRQTSAEDLDIILKNDHVGLTQYMEPFKGRYLLWDFTGNPNVSAETLLHLVKIMGDVDTRTRRRIREHPNASQKVVDMLDSQYYHGW